MHIEIMPLFLGKKIEIDKKQRQILDIDTRQLSILMLVVCFMLKICKDLLLKTTNSAIVTFIRKLIEGENTHLLTSNSLHVKTFKKNNKKTATIQIFQKNNQSNTFIINRKFCSKTFVIAYHILIITISSLFLNVPLFPCCSPYNSTTQRSGQSCVLLKPGEKF